MKKIIVIILCLFFLTGIHVKAEEDYKENYDSFVGETFDEYLDPDTKEKLELEGLNPESPDWVENLQVQNVFSYITSLFKGELKKPLTAFFSIVGIIVLLAAFTSFGQEKYTKNAVIAAPGVIAVIVVSDIYSVLTATTETLKACASFMIGFIPALLSLVAASGQAITGAASGITLLASANAVSSFAANGVMPLMGGYLGVSIASGVSPVISKVNPAATIKHVTMWILTLVSTVFLGVLSVQTAVSSAADNVAVKTAKFVLGTSVPVAGGVLSEAVSTISSSLVLLKSSTAIYAAVALAFLLLPICIEIILWRICFALSAGISEFFGQEKVCALLRAVDSVMACVLGILLLVGGLFIISLAIVVSVGKSV